MNSEQRSDSSDSGAPKRRVIRRVIRRVPKRTSPVVGEEVSDIPIIAPQTVSMPIAQAPIVETPIVAEAPKPASVDPKAMILEQLISRHPRETQSTAAVKAEKPAVLARGSGISSGSAIVESSEPDIEDEASAEAMTPGISPEGRSSIESVWPYLAAAKQSSPAEVHESDKEDFDDASDGRSYFSWLPWFIGALVLIGVGFGVVSYFSGADVTVTPKTESRAIDADIASEKDADASAALPLSVMVIDESLSAPVRATDAPAASSAAFGKLTVYNTQATAQLLIKGTRFTPTSGKVYKIKSSITVPAAKGATPGKIDADVYAESPGPSYNISDKQRFTLPGLKNSDKYTKVYGENMQPISGGSDGTKKVVQSDDEDKAKEALRIQVENKLRSDVDRQLLNKQISFPALYKFEYDEPKLSANDAQGMATMTLTGHLITPVFLRDDLIKELAKSALGASYKGEDLEADGVNKLDVALSDKDKDVDLMKTKTANFHFTGNVKFTWIVNIEAFKSALLSQEKSAFESIVHGFPSIKNAEASLRPMWKQRFPSDAKQIKVTLQ